MKRPDRRVGALTGGAVLLGLVALSLLWAGGVISLPWTHDLDNQISIKPQEMPLLPVEGTVPVEGVVDDGTRENANALVDPGAPGDTASLRRGKIAFDTYCTPCHGTGGQGDGTVARSLPIPPLDLTNPELMSTRSNGAVYYVVRHGSVIMPGYAYALSPERSWDVVHYVRTLKPR